MSLGHDSGFGFTAFLSSKRRRNQPGVAMSRPKLWGCGVLTAQIRTTAALIGVDLEVLPFTNGLTNATPAYLALNAQGAVRSIVILERPSIAARLFADFIRYSLLSKERLLVEFYLHLSCDLRLPNDKTMLHGRSNRFWRRRANKCCRSRRRSVATWRSGPGFTPCLSALIA